MKKNNKGSAFVMVLVILAIVGILAAVALWVSLVNYQMKLTDINVKNNFYSAESVLDQICVGLQTDVSEAYQTAYNKTIVNYSLMSDEQRKNLFEAQYKIALKKKLQPSGAAESDLTYDLKHLTDYVYGDLLDSSTLPYAQINVASSFVAPNGVDGRMDTFESNIVLRGIEVTYTDEKGYTSIIQTDLSLSVPEMKYVTAESMPDTFGYSIVGNKGVQINSNSLISGSMYAGKTGNADNVSLRLNGNVTFSNLQYLISNGTTEVTAGATTVPSGCQLWTDNIVVNSSSQANLLGETYVADDLTLKGANPKVKLGAALEGSQVGGKYIGFGISKEKASESSAIILNGTDSVLDMENLRELVLGGYAYINTSTIDSKESLKNNDVAMGESIAIKGGQIAYLLPPECIAVSNVTKESVYFSNPITYAEYQKIHEADKAPSYTEVDGTIYSKKLGKKLNDYLTPGQNLSEIVSKVFVPSGDNDGLVYYYINLSPERARDYFVDYNVNADLTKLNLYTDFYTDKIQVKTDSSVVYTAGNYTLYDEKEKEAILRGPSSLNMEDSSLEYRDIYQALCCTLSANVHGLTAETSGKSAFENIINETNLTSVVSSGGEKVITYNDPVEGEYKIVIVDGNYTYDASKDPDQKIALIISTQDVIVNQNYCGTIIAKGNILINSVNVDSQEGERMKKILATKIPGTADLAVYNLFNEGANYLIGSSEAEGNVDLGSIPYSDVITYQNWTTK